MVRLWGPLLSLFASGKFKGGYPIDLHRFNFYNRQYASQMGFYYSPYGWIYEMRRTWHGMQPIARRWLGANHPWTPYNAPGRYNFGSAVRAWQALTLIQKDVYNRLKYPPRMSGYNRFLSFYMKGWA